VAESSQGKEPDWWPRDPFGHVFLARVVEKLGAALHTDWTGTEAATKHIDPLPRNLKDATPFHRMQADILLNEFRPDLWVLDFMAGRSAREFSKKDWITAHKRTQTLYDQRQPNLHRLEATRSEIVKRNEAGELELRIQSRSGGPWRDFNKDWWNTDKWRSHFDRCRIDPEYPNGDRPSWSKEDDHWIFATSQSVERLLNQLAGSRPDQKPMSDAELKNFLETYNGPRTESALTQALKDAGKNVTRTRIRAVLPAGRRGRPKKSPE
jgi:hypothetical protein